MDTRLCSAHYDYAYMNSEAALLLDRCLLLGWEGAFFLQGRNQTGNKPKGNPTYDIVSIEGAGRGNGARRTGNLALRAQGDINQEIKRYRPTILFGAESMFSKDRHHQRSSGLNHIICHELAERGVAYVFDFSQLLHASPTYRARIIGRMRQNYHLCKKYGVNISIASFARSTLDLRGRHDLLSFLSLLQKH